MVLRYLIGECFEFVDFPDWFLYDRIVPKWYTKGYHPILLIHQAPECVMAKHKVKDRGRGGQRTGDCDWIFY